MLYSARFYRGAVILVIGISAALPLASMLLSDSVTSSKQEKAADPWTIEQVLQPAELVHDLGTDEGSSAPTIIYVGFRTLFEGAHIPGATFHGTASNEDGLANLKKWTAGLPRSANLVIYCGCCPFNRCPNIRPAYKALHEMGFTHLRILALPTSFAADWVEKGYPIQKGL